VASGAEEPNALVSLGEGGRMEPNQRATITELFEGLGRVQPEPLAQPRMGRRRPQRPPLPLPAGGFYYKMFMHPRSFWKHVYEPFIRQSAGLGPAPSARDADTYEHFHIHVDVLVIGGGIAGLTAARAAGEAGRSVLLIEQSSHWGGRAPVDGATIGDVPAGTWVDEQVAALLSRDTVHLRLRTMGAGVYDHGYVLAVERLTDHDPDADGPRHRLWKIRAGQVVTATGAIERPLAFAGNDLPGVMLASAVRDYAVNWAVAPGERTVVVTNNDDAYRTALALHEAGLTVPVILDGRAKGGGELAEKARELGIRIENGMGIAKVKGGAVVESVTICSQLGGGAGIEDIACDAVAMSGGWSPVVHLWSHCGGKLVWDEAQAHFRPDPDRPPTGADGQPSSLPRAQPPARSPPQPSSPTHAAPGRARRA
jgi:sarcosine oxidase, subunit alpha